MFKFSKLMLILISVPLLFELCFVGGLFLLLHNFEQTRAEEEAARELSSHLNKLTETLVESATAAAVGALIPDESAREMQVRAKQNLTNQLKALTRLSTGMSPERTEQVRTIILKATSYRDKIEAMREALLSEDKEEAKETLLASNTLIADIKAAANEISANQSQAERKSAREQHAWLANLQLLVAVGLCLNAILIGLLLLGFNGFVLSRLKRLRTNTVRLAVDKPLGAPLEGSDEFAQLDGFFRKMAASLQSARKNERLMLEHSPDVICSFDTKTRFTAVNQACEKIWGYAVDDLIGSRWSQIASSEKVAEIVLELRDAPENNEMKGFELAVQHKDGRSIDMLWSGQWSESKKALFFVAHDITEHKHLEQQRSEFTRLLRDNLRSPLVNIQHIHTAIEHDTFGEISEPGKKRLLVASRELQRLIGLVNGLLDVHKLGKDLDLQISESSLSGIISTSVHAVSGFAERHHVALDIRHTQDIVLKVDKERIIQVLVNLLSNAVKFSPTNSSVTVSVDKADDIITINVTDRGRGVPPQMTETIFERFKQVEKSDAHVKGGTGLGLAICKAIIEQHGGKIGVYSELGKGSTFWIKLPRTK